MGFTEAVRTVFKDKYATFSGRASRSEYWWSFLVWVLIIFVGTVVLFRLLTIPAFASSGDFPVGVFVVLGIAIWFYLVTFVPFISVTVRRFHDLNLSGLWCLGFIVAGFIPVLNLFSSCTFLVMMCVRGTNGQNSFGPDPLKPSADSEVFA